MQNLKIAGVVWGTLYLLGGVVSSFTLNKVDFYWSVAVLLLTFIAPLPLAISAFWTPTLSGSGLLLCIVLCAIIFVHLFGVKEGVPPRAVYLYIPHLVFGLAFLATRRDATAKAG